SGRDGETLVVHVPAGTVVRDGGEVVADLDRPGAGAVLAEGGRGGRGNARFATSTRQAPRLGELGEPGSRRRLHLELKLIADIGLVGLPNAGKSTLLAALTGAHPKIADYPFTTLHPNLGVAEVASRPYILADVPGLIEGAHLGAGLGLEFLRHVERTRVLIQVVDVSAGAAEAQAALAVVDGELAAFSDELAQWPRIVALNKTDLPGAAETAAELEVLLPQAIPIAAATGAGCAALLETAVALVDAERAQVPAEVPPAEHRIYRHQPERTEAAVSREGEAYRVRGASVERLVAITDLDNDEAVARLQRHLRRSGVDQALARAGCRDGDTVRIGEAEFEYRSDGQRD
ncbi:MAG: Obg family GTPase CgtA, partial [Candidatus Dormibacteraeota bacterium]|nr:Obg family GTPase CgtA [Candidatus Dormibacteraeota bacterium]